MRDRFIIWVLNIAKNARRVKSKKQDLFLCFSSLRSLLTKFRFFYFYLCTLFFLLSTVIYVRITVLLLVYQYDAEFPFKRLLLKSWFQGLFRLYQNQPRQTDATFMLDGIDSWKMSLVFVHQKYYFHFVYEVENVTNNITLKVWRKWHIYVYLLAVTVARYILSLLEK